MSDLFCSLMHQANADLKEAKEPHKPLLMVQPVHA